LCTYVPLPATFPSPPLHILCPATYDKIVKWLNSSLLDTLNIIYFLLSSKWNEKKNTQRRKHYALAVVRQSHKFPPAIDLTNTPTHTHKQTGPITIHCATAS